MSDKLQQAIQATRVGDKKNAQFLLTQAIQEDPANPQSWYLLSLLVDDKEKKQTYLTKVLNIDPDHEKAHQQLVAVTDMAVLAPETSDDEISEPETPVIISSGSSDLEAQDAGDTLPDWMADDLPDLSDDTKEVEVETAVVTEETTLPDWLEDTVADDWDQEETAVAEIVVTEPDEKENKQPTEKVPEKKKQVVAPKKKPAQPQKSSESNLNAMLIALIVIAILVFLMMAYMIFTTMM